MKALVYEGAERLEIRDWETPEPGENEVFVTLAMCGICGSDMHAWHGHDSRRVPPLILGHEATGTLADGTRVAINPLVNCGTCPACTSGAVHLCPERTLLGMGYHGGFAEAISVRRSACSPLQPQTSFARAALTEPLACVVHAARLAPAAGPDDRVVVLGGGAIGLLAACLFRHQGVRDLRIAETAPHRRAMLADATGATPYDPIETPGAESSADIVFDAVGSGRTRAAASHLVRPGGTIIHIGLQDSLDGLDTRRITLQEIAFIGSYCYKPDDFAEALALLESGAITGEGWTETRPLDAGAQSFRDIDAGSAPPKIILEM